MTRHNVSILCTDPTHPVNPWLQRWVSEVSFAADARILRDVTELQGGDFLFLVSCHQIVRAVHRKLFRHTLVLHASDLPSGRGMSPHIWQILEGQTRFRLTLLNAEDEVDSGDIWEQVDVEIPPTDLHDDINAKLFSAELSLMHWALQHCDNWQPRKQQGVPSYWPRRKPQDSRIDMDLPLSAQFDLLRVSDPERYPAYIEYRGLKYRIRIDKL